jgi:HEAT repeat protein
MHEDDFKTALRAARRDVVDATIGRLQAVAMEAVTALRKALTCHAPTVRVSAARASLEFFFRSAELMDLEDRIAELERQCAEDGTVRISRHGSTGCPNRPWPTVRHATT